MLLPFALLINYVDRGSIGTVYCRLRSVIEAGFCRYARISAAIWSAPMPL
jgi:hypothetical protein